MRTAPRRALVGKAGSPSPAGVVLSVFSHYPQDVILSGPVNIRLTLAEMGSDPDPAVVPGVTRAGYHAHHAIDLSGFSQHKYTLTQAGTPEGTLTFSGAFRTAPSDSDDYALLFYGCYRGINGVSPYPGGYGFAKAFAQNNKIANPSRLPLLAMVGADDIMYLDAYSFSDAGQFLPHLTDAAMDETVYQHCIKWMAWHSMMVNAGYTVALPSKIWCQDNVNQFGIWGDHEIFNDVGYGATSATFRLDGTTGTVARAHAAEAAWDIFWTPGNGSRVDTGSRAFTCDIGQLQLIALDRNYGDGSNREGGGAYNLSGEQIAGVRAAIADSPARFRIAFGAHRYHVDGADYYTTDQSAAIGVFTADSGSLMAKHVNDGSQFIHFYGDLHGVSATQHNKDNGAGTIQEQFIEFNSAVFGLPNGGHNVLQGQANSSEVLDGWYDWSAAAYIGQPGYVNPEYRRLWDYGANPTLSAAALNLTAEQHSNCMLVEAFQSQTPLRVRISLINTRDWSRLCSFDYVDHGTQNLPVWRSRGV